VDPVPDPLLHRKFGSAENRTRDLWACSQELRPVDHREIVPTFLSVVCTRVMTVLNRFAKSSPIKIRGTAFCVSHLEQYYICTVPCIFQLHCLPALHSDKDLITSMRIQKHRQILNKCTEEHPRH
jgi:hypothetical protein